MLGLQLSQILTQMLAFLIMLWVMKRFTWKPILAILDARKAKIASDLANVDAQKQNVQKLTEEYEKKLAEMETLAREKIKEGVLQGTKSAELIQQEAKKEAKILLEKAQILITKEVAQAKLKLKTDVVNLVVAATKKLVEGGLDAETQKKFLTQEIDKEWHGSP